MKSMDLGYRQCFDDFDDFNDFNDFEPSKKPEHNRPQGGKRKTTDDVTYKGNDYEPYDSDIYIVNSINEISLLNYSIFQRLFNGYSLNTDYQYNISLSRQGSVGHGGGGVNAVIYGRLEFNSIRPGSRVRVQGKYKKGLLIINNIVDADSGVTMRINHFWRDPLGRQRNSGRNGRSSSFIALIIILALLAGVFLFKNGISQGVLDNLFIGLIVVGILAFIYVFKINIFNNPSVQKIIFLILLVAAALYFPGGESILACVIIIYGIYLMIKNIF